MVVIRHTPQACASKDFISLSKLSGKPLRDYLIEKNSMYKQLENYESNYKLGATLLLMYSIADLAVTGGRPVGISILKAWNEAKIASAAKQIDFYRTSLGISKTKNIAFAEGKIGSESILEVAVSGESNRMYTLGNPEGRMFTTTEVAGFSRAYDSEVKILESLANKYKDNPNVSGRISLISERSYCASCTGVIQQFQKTFPNIKIEQINGVR